MRVYLEIYNYAVKNHDALTSTSHRTHRLIVEISNVQLQFPTSSRAPSTKINSVTYLTSCVYRLRAHVSSLTSDRSRFIAALNFACRSTPCAIRPIRLRACEYPRRECGRPRERADTRGRRVASRRGIFSTAEPTDDHAVCIFPFRRYEVCGMILYAKSSLELIVNNRIGKVGIRPDGQPPSASHRRRYHPVVHPFRTRRPPADRLPSSATHLI